MSSEFNALKKDMEQMAAVAVGIGSEWQMSVDEVIGNNPVYIWFLNETDGEKPDEKLIKYIKYIIFLHEINSGNNVLINSRISVYNKLAELLGEKRYFILTLNTDDIIYNSNLNKNNICAPCGSIFRLQNECRCDCELTDGKDIYSAIYSAMNTLMENKEHFDRKTVENLLPGCEKCGRIKTFNVHGTENYDESGYLKDWNSYTGWLQKTLNRNIIMLELGVGFELPSVIRWPFEKVAMLNYKAKLYRINEKFPQFPAELKEKGMSVGENSLSFIETNI